MTPEAVQKRFFGQRHEITEALVKLLREMEEGGFYTYDEVSSHLGIEDFRNNGIRYLTSARRILRTEENFYFEIERGVGIRRIPYDEYFKMGEAARQSIARRSQRTVAALRAAEDSGTLNEESAIITKSYHFMMSFLRDVSRKNTYDKMFQHTTNHPSIKVFPRDKIFN